MRQRNPQAVLLRLSSDVGYKADIVEGLLNRRRGALRAVLIHPIVSAALDR